MKRGLLLLTLCVVLLAASRASAFTGRHLTQAQCPQCNSVLTSCIKDATCVTYLMCLGACNRTDPKCSNLCVYTYASNAKVQAFNKCEFANGCFGSTARCPCPPPTKTKKSLKTLLPYLTGHYDIVYGFDPVSDCYPHQQYQFPTTKHHGNFIGNYTLQLGNISIVLPTHYRPQNKDTGAITTKFTFSGVPGGDTWYILDTKHRNDYVLVVYCTSFLCSHGGFVLARQGAPPVPAAYTRSFSEALVTSGWAARHNASWEHWCKIPV